MTTKQIAREAALLSFRARFADMEDAEQEEDEGGEAQQSGRRKFSGIAASGRPINHSWFGRFALDLDGLSIPDGPLPLLRDHDPQQVVGYTSEVSVGDDGLEVQGVLLSDTEHGRDVASLADQGVPWQMSVFIPPTAVEELSAEQTAEVNGHTFQGPGTIFRSAELREVTVTAVGADASTSLAVFTNGGPITAELTATTGENQMSETNEGAAQAAATADDAVQAERQRVTALMSAAQEHGVPEAMLTEAIDQGTSAESATAMFAVYAAGMAAGQERAAGQPTDDREQHRRNLQADDADDGNATFQETGMAQSPDALRAKFDASPELQDEFGGEFERYAALERRNAKFGAST